MLDSFAVGTTDIMDYADAHPNEYFDYTNVRSKHTDFGQLMVSDYEPSSILLDCYEKGLIEWYDLYNGWQRISFGFGMWVCRKNGRYIYITN